MARPSPPAGTLYTVGHGARPIDEFLALLAGAGIRRLVDVRTAPGSRKHPQFGQEALARALEAAGVSYEWRKELGGFRRARPGSRHLAIRSPGFRGYADHMETAEFGEALAGLLRVAAATPTAIMCAETLWWRCHRRMIADAVTVRGWEVLHLLPGREPQRHALHQAARLEGGDVLVYDRPVGQGRLLG